MNTQTDLLIPFVVQTIGELQTSGYPYNIFNIIKEVKRHIQHEEFYRKRGRPINLSKYVLQCVEYGIKVHLFKNESGRIVISDDGRLLPKVVPPDGEPDTKKKRPIKKEKKEKEKEKDKDVEKDKEKEKNKGKDKGNEKDDKKKSDDKTSSSESNDDRTNAESVNEDELSNPSWENSERGDNSNETMDSCPFDFRNLKRKNNRSFSDLSEVSDIPNKRKKRRTTLLLKTITPKMRRAHRSHEKKSRKMQYIPVVEEVDDDSDHMQVGHTDSDDCSSISLSISSTGKVRETNLVAEQQQIEKSAKYEMSKPEKRKRLQPKNFLRAEKEKTRKQFEEPPHFEPAPIQNKSKQEMSVQSFINLDKKKSKNLPAAKGKSKPVVTVVTSNKSLGSKRRDNHCSDPDCICNIGDKNNTSTGEGQENN